jgi:hypothetical protein
VFEVRKPAAELRRIDATQLGGMCRDFAGMVQLADEELAVWNVKEILFDIGKCKHDTVAGDVFRRLELMTRPEAIGDQTQANRVSGGVSHDGARAEHSSRLLGQRIREYFETARRSRVLLGETRGVTTFWRPLIGTRDDELRPKDCICRK